MLKLVPIKPDVPYMSGNLTSQMIQVKEHNKFHEAEADKLLIPTASCSFSVYEVAQFLFINYSNLFKPVKPAIFMNGFHNPLIEEDSTYIMKFRKQTIEILGGSLIELNNSQQGIPGYVFDMANNLLINNSHYRLNRSVYINSDYYPVNSCEYLIGLLLAELDTALAYKKFSTTSIKKVLDLTLTEDGIEAHNELFFNRHFSGLIDKLNAFVGENIWSMYNHFRVNMGHILLNKLGDFRAHEYHQSKLVEIEEADI